MRLELLGDAAQASRAEAGKPDGVVPVTAAPSVPEDSPGRWGAVVLALLVLVPTALNAIALWPELSLPIPSLNDDAHHYLYVQRASEALESGQSPFDHWAVEVELSFPHFLYYQHLPHLAVVLLHRLLLKQVDLLTLFNLVRYLLMVGLPLTVYWSMRRLGFSPVAGAVGAAASTLFSSNKGYGLEYGSYVWRGHGMFTQLWAAHLSLITLACLNRLLERGKGYVAAVVSASALGLSHLVYSYMLVPAVLVLFLVGLNRENARPRLLRLAVTGTLAAVITSYLWLPFVLLKAYLWASPYLPRWRYDSFGAREVLTWLVNGDMLDWGRLPVLTLLLALGVAAAVFTRTRPARLALALFFVWVALYFGRPTWGSLVDVLPMHEGLPFHRLVGAVHLAAILLIGLGGEWVWRQLAPLGERWRAVTAGLVVLALLFPALRERERYYALNTVWMEETRKALEADTDARTILAALRELPPGRTYAGLRANWGEQLRLGHIRFYNLLTFHRIVAVSPPYASISLNADLIWHFDERNPAHYDLFNVRYVVAPTGLAMPAFLRPIKGTPRYTLYRAETGGYARFGAITEVASISSQPDLLARNLSWLTSADPAAGRFLRYDYPAGSEGPTADAAAGAPGRRGCPGGKISEERVMAGRIDLRVECPEPSVLVLKETYHPNWRVAVDGRQERPFMVSPSFIGVGVLAGVHQVRAEYRSPAYKTALLLLGAFALVATVCFRRRFERLDARLSSRPGRSSGAGLPRAEAGQPSGRGQETHVSQRRDSGQTDQSVAKNISFFRDHRDTYSQNVQQLDTYVAMRASVDEALRGVNRLLDIGNGGVFDYDVGIVSSIVALDLFLDQIDISSYPAHIGFKAGSALDIPEPDESFDGVLIAMLLHHLVGRTARESLDNVRCAVREAFRVLRPGGRLIILESCVPRWFYGFEAAVFSPASRVINAISAHPATLQYPAPVLAGVIREHAADVAVSRIPKGRWLLQFGYKFPAALTPASPYRFVAQKRGGAGPAS